MLLFHTVPLKCLAFQNRITLGISVFNPKLGIRGEEEIKERASTGGPGPAHVSGWHQTQKLGCAGAVVRISSETGHWPLVLWHAGLHCSAVALSHGSHVGSAAFGGSRADGRSPGRGMSGMSHALLSGTLTVNHLTPERATELTHTPAWDVGYPKPGPLLKDGSTWPFFSYMKTTVPL